MMGHAARLQQFGDEAGPAVRAAVLKISAGKNDLFFRLPDKIRYRQPCRAREHPPPARKCLWELKTASCQRLSFARGFSRQIICTSISASLGIFQNLMTCGQFTKR